MGNTHNVDMSSQEVSIKIVEAPQEAEKTAKKAKAVRTHSKKFAAVRAKLDKTRKYDLLDAVELVKKLSYSSFPGTISAELTVKEEGMNVEVTMPHQSGKTKKVVIVTDDVLKEIEAGELNFDILVSSPQFMPKLAKFARVLGPKGLMPNPKNGTLTPNPERAVQELSAGKTMLKGERKQPLMHVTIGKTSLENDKLTENIVAVLKALKGKAEKLSLSATMSPGVKVNIEPYL